MPQALGNDISLGRTGDTGKPITLSRRDRARHIYLCGATRTGKTKLLEAMCRQDLTHHPRHRCPVFVIDPHGTLFDSVLGFAAGENLKRLPIIPIDLRRGDVIVSYNMLRRRKGIDLAVLCRGFVDAVLHSWGQSNTNETPRLATWLYAFITFVCERDCTLIEALHLVRDPAARNELTDQVEHFVARTTFQSARSLKERDFQDRIESTLYRINRFLSTQLVRAMLCQTGDSLDLDRALAEGSIVLANLSTEGALVAEEDATTLGSVLLTDLWLAAKRRGKREEGRLRPAYCYLDEFQNYVTPTMAKGLSEASGFGLHFTLAHQFPSQLSDQGELGQMVLNSVLANAKNKIVFQLSHPADVEMLASILYRQDVDPDQVKDEIYQTKVMGHSLQYHSSYSSGVTRGTERGWQQSHGSSEGHALGTNWAHTDAASESFTHAEGAIDGASAGITLSDESSESESDGSSISNGASFGDSYSSSSTRGENELTSSGSSTSEGTNWSEANGRNRGQSHGRHDGRSETLGFGRLDGPRQEELRRYEYTKLGERERRHFRRRWPDVEAMTANEVEEFKRTCPSDFTLSETAAGSETNSSGESSMASAGGSRTVSRSESATRGISRSNSEARGINRSTSVGDARSQSMSSGMSHGRSVSAAVSQAVTRGDSETYGTSSSDASGGSESFSTETSHSVGESASRSESNSQGITHSPMLMPIIGRELSSRQCRSIDEQLFRFAQIIDGLRDRHCVVRLASMHSPAQLYTRTVRKPLATAVRVSSWTRKLLSRIPFALPIEAALAAVAARENSSLTSLRKGGQFSEPASARRLLTPNEPGTSSGHGARRAST